MVCIHIRFAEGFKPGEDQFRHRSPPDGGFSYISILFVGDIEMIQLRYTNGSPWDFELVDPKRKDYNKLFEDASEHRLAYLKCDWRHILSYLLGDEEMQKFVRDKSEARLRRNVMSWMFKVLYSGAKHKPMYMILTDAGSDLRNGRISAVIDSDGVWNSIVTGFDRYLKRKVSENEPAEFEMSSRYYSHGVAKRETRHNELWSFTREHGSSRRVFEDTIKIESILI
jgi:hypothetical protein